MRKTIIYSLILLLFSTNFIFASANNIKKEGNISIQGIEDNPATTIIAMWLIYRIKIFFSKDKDKDKKSNTNKTLTKCEKDTDGDGICDDVDDYPKCKSNIVDCKGVCNGSYVKDKKNRCCPSKNIDDCDICYGYNQCKPALVTGCISNPNACNYNSKATNIVECVLPEVTCSDGSKACDQSECKNKCDGIQPYTETWNNGKIKVKGKNKDCKPYGEWIWYYKSEKVKEIIGYYKNGKKDGLWTEYYLSKNQKQMIKYKDGKKNGIYYEFEDFPKSLGRFYKIKGQYEKDLKIGKWETFYSNGNKKSISYYEGGNKVKRWKEFYNSNNNFSVKFIGNYLDNKAHGKHEWFHKNGKKRKIEEFSYGNNIGEYFEYHESGNLKAKGIFQNNDKKANWPTYCDNGTVNENKSFKNGKLHGTYNKYYCDGKRRVKGMYKNGDKCGKWKFYDKNGSLDEDKDFESCY